MATEKAIILSRLTISELPIPVDIYRRIQVLILPRIMYHTHIYNHWREKSSISRDRLQDCTSVHCQLLSLVIPHFRRWHISLVL